MAQLSKTYMIRNIIFHLCLLAIIVTATVKTGFERNLYPPEMLKDLLGGVSTTYRLPGSQFEIFKQFLPPNQKINFLVAETPNEFASGNEWGKFYYDAQNYLAPLVLNRRPEEKLGILYCPNQEIANARLKQTNLYWVLTISDGKGIVASTQ
jgi:hypothetical protein